MLPSVTAASAKPEAFAEAFEVALAFALDEGTGSKVTAPEVALGSGATLAASEVAFSPGAGSTLQEASAHASLQPSSQVDHHRHHPKCHSHTPRQQVHQTTSPQTNRLKSNLPQTKFDLQDLQLHQTSSCQVHSHDPKGIATQHVHSFHKSKTPKHAHHEVLTFLFLTFAFAFCHCCVMKVHMGILSFAFLIFTFSFTFLAFPLKWPKPPLPKPFFPLSPPMSMGAGPCDDEAAPASMCLD